MQASPQTGLTKDQWLTIGTTVVCLVAAFGIAYFSAEFRWEVSVRSRRSWAWLKVHRFSVPIAIFGAAIIWKIVREESSHSSRYALLFVLMTALCCLSTFWFRAELARRIPYQKCDACRWEQLETITYSHLAYEPLLRMNDVGRTPEGFGVTLLEELLKGTSGTLDLKYEGDWRNWANILDGLSPSGDARVIATPLFATFDRSRRVRFTAPLFYSNIGLYMTKQTCAACDWDADQPLTAASISKLLQGKGAKDLKFLCIEGEISEKLANKYAHPRAIRVDKPTKAFAKIFEEISTSGERYAIFCESYSGHRVLESMYSANPSRQMVSPDRKIVNLMRDYEILYPVCYAVRMGDYQLANLINLRLLDRMSKRKPLERQPLEMLIEELKNGWGKDGDQAVKDIEKHFISEWPFNSPTIKEL